MEEIRSIRALTCSSRISQKAESSLPAIAACHRCTREIATSLGSTSARAEQASCTTKYPRHKTKTMIIYPDTLKRNGARSDSQQPQKGQQGARKFGPRKSRRCPSTAYVRRRVYERMHLSDDGHPLLWLPHFSPVLRCERDALFRGRQNAGGKPGMSCQPRSPRGDAPKSQHPSHAKPAARHTAFPRLHASEPLGLGPHKLKLHGLVPTDTIICTCLFLESRSYMHNNRGVFSAAPRGMKVCV